MDSQRIVLGGRDFDVPPLAFRQIRVITLAAQRLNAADLSALTEQNLADLFEIALIAVQKAEPELKKADLEDMHITVDELLAAKRPICEQAGMVFVLQGESQATT